ncbi:hypothetical protein LEP1GSC021_1647 [Leptospira noguchii str. 1993005606]|uniref:hypothetical protein n=1 Tax=Leptospira noguchii TaxID=28182 RepID=UPI000352FCD8|nr:hypothetical protein [Leptospira noguchii]EPE83498.1 hypothetical protein LEP1GSC021_1647 [Leptospira noguchii str. 1993005606]
MNPNEKLEAHYSLLLGILSPWSVESVELNVTTKRVDIEVVYDEKEMVECPDCGKRFVVTSYNVCYTKLLRSQSMRQQKNPFS